MRILGVIPARGGSKRILGKALKKFNGKPLLSFAIESALASKLDRVIVTTDDPAIQKLALRAGASAPFLRPADLAHDKAAIEPVLRHALEWLEANESYKPDAVALLMPTNPARTAADINAAIALFVSAKPDSVVSVVEARANSNPHWILKHGRKGEVLLFSGKALKDIEVRSQDLPPAYIRNDVIYLLKPKNLYEKKPNLYGKKVKLLVMDDSSNIDINTPEDWFVAEQKLKFRKKKR